MYSDKLDVSFGFLLVQILTRQFPNPTNRFQTVDDPQHPHPLRMLVPETQQCQSHLKLISDTHHLKAVAMSCLKDKATERPSAQQLSERVSELKQAPQCAERMQLHVV